MIVRLALPLAAAIAAAPFTPPLAAQDHSGHAGHAMQAAQPSDEMDHCAIGHLPPEQCPSQDIKPALPDTMDHCAMGHLPPKQCGKEEETSAPEPVSLPEMDHCAMGHLPPEQCPAKNAPASHEHGAMDHSAMGHSPDPALPRSGPPARAFEGPQHAADRFFGADAMAEARATNHATHGDMKVGTFMAERLEARIREGEDGFLWDVQGWYGGDIDKFVFKSEGEGGFSDGVEDAELQALWGHAIGPFFDLQAGARLDVEPETRSHLVLGVQGLAPYMWHVDGALFLSDRGDLTARLEGEYDYKLTQRLILQPRAEIELTAQDIPEREIGAGITKIETGLRLRYEFAREFAPYIGVGYEAKLGETADIARAAGEDPDGIALILGLRAWF
ncbi:copper resistance protein B [Erythrobacteraceae bacterium WH01K]|nr:copper resistance protein B [Erythrobacteraceae bacterium WH01K]